MQIRVLGHLEASVDDRPIGLGGAKQRAVLAMLGLEANRTVTADRLIEGLWGEAPPASATKMVQNYVWRLRGVLAADGGAEIFTHGRGYELRIDPDGVDVHRLERLVTEAGRAAEAGEPGVAAREALALFRGDPLADLAGEPFAAAEIRRLGELRETAAELAIDADLAAGRHQEVVGEIDALLAGNPLRERLHAQRMLALYRCGRQAEALEAYRVARHRLVEEIGVEPGPQLRTLHDSILRQDPSLDVDPAVTELPRELDATSSAPLTGRDDTMRRIHAHWRRAAGGAGALVTVVGGYGMGKTRVAAAIAGDAHREGAAVLYAAGTGPPEAALAAIARTLGARRPTLLVLDDAGPRARRGACRAARPRRAPRRAARPRRRHRPGRRRAGLEPRDAVALEPLEVGAVREIAGLYASGGDAGAVPVDALFGTSRGVPRRVHEAASEWARQEARRRVDAVGGPDGGSVAARRGRWRSSWPAASSTCSRRASAPAGDRRRRGRRGAGGLPVQGPGDFDADDAELLLRARAARRRDGRAARRRAAARRRRPVGQRQVVRGPGRSAARARGRRAARAATAGRVACSAPARIRCASCAARSATSAASSARARRRSVRGAVHRLPRRAASAASSSRSSCAPRAIGRRRRRARGARRLLRPLRRLSRAVASAGREHRARRRDDARRAAARDRAARAAGRAAASSRSSSTRCWPTSRASPARCRCSRPRCSSSGAGATGGGCARRVHAQRRRPGRGRAARRGRVRRSSTPSAAGRGPQRAAAARRRGRGPRDRAPPDRARGAGGRAPPDVARGRSRGSPRAACDDRRRRRRGRARGAAARMAAAARLARGGRAGPAPAPPAHRRRPCVGRGRSRPRRPVSRRAARRGARVALRPRGAS